MTTYNKQTNNTSYNKGVDAFEASNKNPKMMKVFGTFYYTRVGKPITQLNTAEGLVDVDPYFTATMGLTEKSADYMRSKGFTVYDPNDNIPKPHIRFKRKVKDANTAVDFFDADGKEMNKDILIGNGSYGQALVMVYDFPDGGKGGALLGVQVNDLKTFDPDAKGKPKGNYKPTTAAKPTPSTNGRKPMTWSKKEAPQENSEDLDDEIPF